MNEGCIRYTRYSIHEKQEAIGLRVADSYKASIVSQVSQFLTDPIDYESYVIFEDEPETAPDHDFLANN